MTTDDSHISSLIKNSSHMIFSPLSHLQALLFLMRKTLKENSDIRLAQQAEKADKTLVLLTRRILAVTSLLEYSSYSNTETKKFSLMDIITSAIQTTNREAGYEKIVCNGVEDMQLTCSKEELTQGCYFLFTSLEQKSWTLTLTGANTIVLQSDNSPAKEELHADELQYKKICVYLGENILKKYGLLFSFKSTP